jgi:hypothetical protein
LKIGVLVVLSYFVHSSGMLQSGGFPNLK